MKDGDFFAFMSKRMSVWNKHFVDGLVAFYLANRVLSGDSFDATNPWNPWLAIAVTLDRVTERGTELFPEEKLTREQSELRQKAEELAQKMQGQQASNGERQDGHDRQHDDEGRIEPVEVLTLVEQCL